MNSTDLADEPVLIRTRFMVKVFYAFAALAMLSTAISLAGKWFGGSIAMAGHTDDRTTREIVIGNNVIVAPANTIRFERQRVSGVASRLDLYFRWPQMDGFSREAGATFNNAGGAGSLLFVAFEPRAMSRDMSGRFEPIYRSLITGQPVAAPGGVSVYALDAKAGYLNEVLAVAQRQGKEPFVARCLTGPAADESLAPCERDIQVGDELSLSYRFPRELLAEWKRLDAAVLATADLMLKR